MAAAGPRYKYIDIFFCVAQSLRRWFALAERKRLRRTSCSVSITVQRKHKCFVVPRVFSAAAEQTTLHRVASNVSTMTRCCTTHARTAAPSGVKPWRTKFTRSAVFWLLWGRRATVRNVLNSTVRRNYDVKKFWCWFVTCSQTKELYIERLRVCSKVQTLRVKMCFLSREFDVVCHFGL